MPARCGGRKAETGSDCGPLRQRDEVTEGMKNEQAEIGNRNAGTMTLTDHLASPEGAQEILLPNLEQENLIC